MIEVRYESFESGKAQLHGRVHQELYASEQRRGAQVWGDPRPYGYEQIGDKWELTYNDFIIQIVQTTDNFKDLSEFRKLIIDSKSIFFYMPFTLIIALLLTTILLVKRFGKKYFNKRCEI